MNYQPQRSVTDYVCRRSDHRQRGRSSCAAAKRLRGDAAVGADWARNRPMVRAARDVLLATHLITGGENMRRAAFLLIALIAVVGSLFVVACSGPTGPAGAEG